MINSVSNASVNINSTKDTYPTNLSVICDSCAESDTNYGKYSEKQIATAFQQRNEREYNAFGKYAGDATPAGIVKFATAYIKFYDSLSPEEQKNPTYAGTKESATALLNGAKAMEVESNTSGTNTKYASLFDCFSVFTDRLKTTHKAQSTHKSEQHSTSVMLSAEARRLQIEQEK